MTTLYLILFIFGLILGSFFNVVILRYDPKQSLFCLGHLTGRSKCTHCHKQLSWYELFPVISYFALGGRCKDCKAVLNWQYPLVEILTGVVTFGVPYLLGQIFYIKQVFLTGNPIEWFIVLSILWIWIFYFFIILAFIDLRHKIIPNEINFLLGLFGVALIFFYDLYDKFGLISGTFVGGYAAMLGFRENIWANHFGAAVLMFLFFLLIVILSQGRGMGMGDVKLVAVLGLIFGWPDVLLIVFLSFIIGAVYGIFVLIKDKKGMSRLVPFGPFLVLSSALVFFFGQTILRSYFSLFGIL